ncbi:VPLPA-CTERM sorting domain-containing protein [Tateyamaria armeniaca]|uniref:VPLPA-CTERM sorting domain-containing protein n=1 Tax=Tateyamaria armeniaca TaxID=2518930 RepID=A0ABW8UYN3_9RHOB
MFKFLTAAFVASGVMAGAASATTVSFTTFPNSFNNNPETLTFDANAWADNATIASTAGGGTPAASPASGADGDLSTATNLNNSIVEISFTDNVLINGAGADLVIFQNTNNNVIQLSSGATFPNLASGTFRGFIRANEPGNTSGFEIGVLEFDLSDLGFADGAEVTDGLFLRRASIFSTVWDVAALNSRSVVAPPVNPVPLPAGLPLLLAGLGVFALLRRKG